MHAQNSASDNPHAMLMRTPLIILIALATMLACPIAIGPAKAYAVDLQQGDQTSIVEPIAASSPNSVKTAASAKPSKKKLNAFKKTSANFSLNLFKQSVAAKGKNENVTIAPMSVLTALTMTANGASGKTARQMRKTLAGKNSIRTLDKCLYWYNNQLVNTEKARLSSANAIWYHNAGGFKVKSSFIKTNTKYLGSELYPSNFANPATVDAINSWVSDKTNAMIPKLVDRLDTNSRIALLNALYFDAEWSKPYEETDVHPATFTTAAGDRRTVQMMYSDEGLYLENENATGFIRPYIAGYSYVALLPNKGIDLGKFVSGLSGNTFRSIISKATSEHVRAGLPKYAVEYTSESMAKQLRAMGIKQAFNPDKANFKKMGKDPSGNLFIGQVVHKTKVEVDERGTKAAAVTGVIMKANSALMRVKTVILDRPFVYAIVDDATRLPLFIGTVANIGE